MARYHPKLSEITQQDIDNFHTKYKKGSPDDCWIWQTGKVCGYGQFSIRRFPFRAHRVAYFLHYGVNPTELNVCHNCPDGDNPACVNPNHLFLGTHQDNVADRVKKGRTASGDNNGKRTHPEKIMTGNDHWSKIHPERLARGEKSGKYTKPECTPRGEKHGMSKLTASDIPLMRQLYKEKHTQWEIAKRFNVTQATISRILLGEAWKHVKG